MEVIGKDGILEDVDTEDRGEGLQALANPFSSVGVVFLGKLIEASQKGATDTAMVAMNKADFVADELLTAERAGHGGSLQEVRGVGPITLWD